MKLPQEARAVITGAGGGFGRALALDLARRGAHLVLGDVNTDAVQNSAKLARQVGAASAVALTCDVTKVDDVEVLAAACDGEIDLVVNNAGVSAAGMIGELSLAEWRWTLDVDLWGVIHGCHVFVPRLRAQGHGHILNVASAAGLLAAPRMGPYNVAKAGVIALSDTLATELAGSGVGVTALCPLFFKTNIVANAHFSDTESRAMAQTLMARGKPVEIIVARALRAVEKNRRYCLPTADARWLWRLKRLLPVTFGRLLGKLQPLVARR